MILSCLAIALAAALAAAAAWLLFDIRKKGIAIGMPVLLGLACMAIGYVGASALLLVANAVVSAFASVSFIEHEAAAFYLALTTGALVGLAMFVMLKKPLAQRRSAYETLAFGIGVVLPMLVYKVVDVVLVNVSYILLGAEYGESALLLLNSVVGLALTLPEVFLAVLLASLLNRNKALTGLIVTLACETAVYAAQSVRDAFGAPDFIGPVAGVLALTAVAVYDARAWSSFPPVKKPSRARGSNQKIPWPEPGEDGR
ncbi:MAG TPA: hypothetical protein VN540_01915 [Clostridia bacterium]|nr:hypothetical protein [Clostridia bacterium]